MNLLAISRSRSRSWSPTDPMGERRRMIIEPPPSSELLGMKEVIPDEPMSPDEDPGKIGKKNNKKHQGPGL